MFDMISNNQISNLIYALTIVILIIIVCAGFVFFSRKRFSLEAIKQKLNSNARLAIIETIRIDQKRKLILIRKDQKEHLILIGGVADLIIETSPSSTARKHSVQGIQLDQGMQFDQGMQSGDRQTSVPKPKMEQEAITSLDQARDRIFPRQSVNEISDVQIHAAKTHETQTPAATKPPAGKESFQTLLENQYQKVKNSQTKLMPDKRG